jgi:hypothetical protein
MNISYIGNSGSWIQNFKHRTSYDSNGNVIERYSQVYESNTMTWENSSRSTYQFNASNQETERLEQSWNGAAWVNNTKYTFTYVNGDRTDQLRQQWVNNAWENVVNFQNSYDANHNPIYSLTRNWVDDMWLNYSQYTTSYDTNNKPLESTTQTWSNGAWENSYHGTYTYDPSRDFIITHSYGETWSGSEWESNALRRYYYEAVNLGWAEKVFDEILVQVFPNPSTNFVGFKFKMEKNEVFTISIFNLSGQLMHAASEQAHGEITYTMQHNLSPGHYMYRLEIADQMSTGKLVVIGK